MSVETYFILLYKIQLCERLITVLMIQCLPGASLFFKMEECDHGPVICTSVIVCLGTHCPNVVCSNGSVNTAEALCIFFFFSFLTRKKFDVHCFERWHRFSSVCPFR